MTPQTKIIEELPEEIKQKLVEITSGIVIDALKKATQSFREILEEMKKEIILKDILDETKPFNKREVNQKLSYNQALEDILKKLKDEGK